MLSALMNLSHVSRLYFLSREQFHSDLIGNLEAVIHSSRILADPSNHSSDLRMNSDDQTGNMVGLVGHLVSLGRHHNRLVEQMEVLNK